MFLYSHALRMITFVCLKNDWYVLVWLSHPPHPTPILFQSWIYTWSQMIYMLYAFSVRNRCDKCNTNKMLMAFITTCGNIFPYFISVQPHYPITLITQNQNQNSVWLLVLKKIIFLGKTIFFHFFILLHRKGTEFFLQWSIFSN